MPEMQIVSQLPIIHALTVAILEDDENLINGLKSALTVFGFVPVRIFSATNAVELARNNDTKFFILDIQIAEKKAGLDVLEDIKEVDSSAFVCIYSSYIDNPNLYQRAKKLNADFILSKTGNDRLDICQLAHEILTHHQKLVSRELEILRMEAQELRSGGMGHVNWQNGKVQPAVLLHSVSEPPVFAPTSGAGVSAMDANVAEFERLRSLGEWQQKHAGMYVGIVNGKIEGAHSSLEALLAQLRSKFSSEARFVVQVSSDSESALDMPSPFAID